MQDEGDAVTGIAALLPGDWKDNEEDVRTRLATVQRMTGVNMEVLEKALYEHLASGYPFESWGREDATA